jgi:murein L,D-transpeptidase YcbB/YkuD
MIEVIKIILILMVFASGCNFRETNEKAQNKGVTAAIRRLPVFPIGDAITDSSIDEFLRQNKTYRPYSELLHNFYGKRHFSYVWLNQYGLTPRVDMLVNMNRENFKSQELSSDSLFHLYHHILLDSAEHRTTNRLRALELKITSEFFAFADEEWSGNNEKLLQQSEWFIPKKTLDYEAILDTLLENHSKPFNVPVYRQYELLKSYLRQYRKIELDGGWPLVTLDANILKSGDTTPVVRMIKKRLSVTGDYTAADSSDIFNAELTEGIKNFQRRCGIPEDGKIDQKVVDEMNIPVHQKIEQMIINIERCKWVPVALEGDYLIVNLPEFRMHAYEGNQYLWNMNVVIGKATDKTVIFTGNLKYIVLNPYWNVPESIFTKEILPKLKKDPGYLESQQMEIITNQTPDVPIDPFSVNWDQPESKFHAYIIRQKPGPHNALGRIKFLFPNEYNIYLHDTPSKSLFERTARSFSHGCIRVADPEKLALFLLAGEKEWNPASLDKAMAPGKEKYIVLKKPVPVFIVYFTAWVDRHGKLNFRNDIYNHDAVMSSLLLNEPDM